MSDVNLTVIGHVGTDPVLATSASGTEWCTFRLASTRRVRDPRTGEWADGDTLWFTVKLFRDRARHVNLSLRKGDPVVVVGRLAVEEWDADRVHEIGDGTTVTLSEHRTRQVIEAQHVGVDATRGLVRFGRVAADRGTEDHGTDERSPDDRSGDGAGDEDDSHGAGPHDGTRAYGVPEDDRVPAGV